MATLPVNAIDLNTLGYGGITIVVGTALLYFAWGWIKDRAKRGEQAEALFKIERDAHMSTRAALGERIQELEEEVTNERGLRKAAEMELRTSNAAHDQDRTLWRQEREELRDLTEKLRGEVRTLNSRVIDLTDIVDRRKNDRSQ